MTFNLFVEASLCSASVQGKDHQPFVHSVLYSVHLPKNSVYVSSRIQVLSRRSMYLTNERSDVQRRSDEVMQRDDPCCSTEGPAVRSALKGVPCTNGFLKSQNGGTQFVSLRLWNVPHTVHDKALGDCPVCECSGSSGSEVQRDPHRHLNSVWLRLWFSKQRPQVQRGALDELDLEGSTPSGR